MSNNTVDVSGIYQKTAEKNGHLLEISYIIGLISGSLKWLKVSWKFMYYAMYLLSFKKESRLKKESSPLW